MRIHGKRAMSETGQEPTSAWEGIPSRRAWHCRLVRHTVYSGLDWCHGRRTAVPGRAQVVGDIGR